MKKTNRVRALFKNFSKKFRGRLSVDVVERPRIMGCAASVIDGLTQMFRLHERLIVIEDDIFTSPHTLRVLNEGLASYADYAKIFNIAAWTPPHIARKLPADYPYVFIPFPVSTAGAGFCGENAFRIYQTFKHSALQSL